MLKLRVVLSFLLAAMGILSSLDSVSAQAPPIHEYSYSGSGDSHDAGDLPSVTQSPSTAHEAAPTGSSTTTNQTPAPTTKTPTASSGSGIGDGTVPRWGVCEENSNCEAGTFCKTLDNISLCYPE
ncbi:hypothetical protein PHYBOEH_010163 [Phytophthora boehmeriae]|uniref:CBM1 domain-containing protein n=1 Tax=Phytophthora boehmeriae TaxID=109152 RepID=A0A8T1VNR4_9STRA|nr:hypothetical protein PHYBOEH_010163 [Phytophthora boehmeriae]